MQTEHTTPRPLRRFRVGAHGAMVEDDKGAYVRHDELLEWLLVFAAKLRVAKLLECV